VKVSIIKKKNNLNLDLKKIAIIHKNSYDKNHFSSTFSIKKLIEYNGLLIKYSDLSLIATTDAGVIVGYIISGKSVAKGVKKFTNLNKIYLILLLLQKPNFLFQKLYSIIINCFLSQKNNLTKFRLLSISVDPAFQSKGIGVKMLNCFELKLKKLGVRSYGLSVKNKNLKAIKFYIRNKFIKEKVHIGNTYFYKKIIH
jgi:ribosomal protein S18 acetylase RimI-like enzyme